MQGVEADQRCVADGETAPNSVRDRLSNKWNGRNEARNDRRPPETHLPSWQDIPNKGGCHHQKKDYDSSVSKNWPRGVGLII